jgi:two-component system heavy metal sensor histidine kinase CusS
MKKHSIVLHLALMLTFAAVLIFGVTGTLFHIVQRNEIHSYQSEEMKTRFMLVEKMVARQKDAERWPMIQEKLKDLTASGDVRYILESADPQYRFGTPLPDGTTVDALNPEFGRIHLDGRNYRTLTKVIPSLEKRPDVRFTLASDLTSLEQTSLTLGTSVFFFSLLGAVAVAGLSWGIARSNLAHVDRLSQHAEKIGAHNLSERLPTDDLPEELAGLVLSFNGTLQRLEQSYMQLSTFNADVAHELRTPLGNMIGQTQVALSRERPAPELLDVLQSNLEEMERLRTIISDMLFLARADQGELAVNRTSLELAAEVRKSAEFLDVLFEEAGMSLRVEGDARVVAESALTGRAITNLITNAIQHGTHGSAIVAHIDEKDGYARIAIENEGPAIDPQHINKIFDRFYRVSAARGQSWENHGLGLAIVKAVATMHGGRVFARSGNGKTQIGFTLPLKA